VPVRKGHLPDGAELNKDLSVNRRGGHGFIVPTISVIRAHQDGGHDKALPTLRFSMIVGSIQIYLRISRKSCNVAEFSKMTNILIHFCSIMGKNINFSASYRESSRRTYK
jgi:hypothetical protein